MKEILKLIFIIAIGLVTITLSILRFTVDSFSRPGFQVQTTPYSLVFYNADLSEELLKLSPFDDYYYTNSLKKHIADQTNFNGSKSLTNQFLKFAKVIFLNKSVITWDSFIKPKGKVSYNVINLPNKGIQVIREFELPYKANFIGQSLVICERCIVSDQSRRMFLNKEFISDNELNLAQSANLTPLVINNQLLPNDIKRIIVYDQNFNPKISIEVENGQQVFFDQKWRILEFKTQINTDKGSVKQNFFFY